MYVSGLLQAAALDVITQPAWQTHVRNLRQQLKSRRDLLVESLRIHAPQARLSHVPDGGLSLWVLPDGTDLERLSRDCESGPSASGLKEGSRIFGEVLKQIGRG